MGKKYIKPELRPKELRKHLLTTESNLYVGGKGRLDAKEYSTNFFEEDEE